MHTPKFYPNKTHSHRKNKVVGAATLLLVLVLLPHVAQAQAGFQGIGIPWRYTSSVAWDVSANGSAIAGVAGNSATNEAFRWTSATGPVLLGDLPGEGIRSGAYGISGDGSVLVGFATPDNSSDHAFRWTSGTGMVDLGDLGGFTTLAVANGISADGNVIVGRADNASGQDEAFRWTSGGGMVGLGDLPGGPFRSEASAASGDGSVIVGWSNNATDQEAFRWTSATGMVGLGDLPGGGFNSIANGISADGSVIVGRAAGVNSFDEACRWTSSGIMSLGDLPGGAFGSSAYDVSADGSIIVGYGTDENNLFRAMFWTESTGMVNLQDYLIAQGATGLAGWTLQFALAVSDDGTTIVGYGLNPSNAIEGFIAIIPEPSVWILALVGGLLIAVGRRRLTLLAIAVAFASTFTLSAQVPQLINYQGRVVVGSTNFNGTGQFKFALVNSTGSTTYWSNDGTSTAGSQPTNAVSLSVANGLYSVLLGDASLTNMTAIPTSVFNNSDVRLRVWFNDGTNGSQLLAPDQRIVSVGYAVIAANVADNAITSAKIANGAVSSAKIANGAVTATQLANGAVNSAKIDNTTVQQRVIGTAAGGSFITGINSDGTVTSAAGGTITGVTAGTGMTGGGTSGSVSLGIANGGVGSTQIATGAVGTSQLLDGSIATADIANGAVNSGKIDNTTVQQRVTGTAPAGSFLTGINANGTVTSAAGAANIWSLNGTIAYYNGGPVAIGTNVASGGYLNVETPNGYGIIHSSGAIHVGTYAGGSTGGGWFGTASNHPLSFFVNNEGASMTIRKNSGVSPGYNMDLYGDVTVDGGLVVKNTSTSLLANYFLVEASDGTDIFQVYNQNGSDHLLMVGDAYKTAGGNTWNVASDRRFKQNIRTYDRGLDQVLQLRSVRFHYRDDPKRGLSSNREEIGFVAQDVRDVIPEAVTEDQDGYLFLKGDAIYWAGINAIQELNAKLEKERTENAQLKTRLDQIEQRLSHGSDIPGK